MVRIIIDDREKSSVRKYLDQLGADIVIQRMPVGDIQIAEDYAFELKIGGDFLQSAIGAKKLEVIGQTRDLAISYKRAALLIGGSLEDILTQRNIHKNAVMAFLEVILFNGCAIRFLHTEEIVANYIFEAAKKEQGENDKNKAFQPHGKRSHLSPKKKKEYIVSSIDDVGPQQAINLLQWFGSVKAIANASYEELITVDLIGKKTAQAIQENLSGIYFGGK